MANEVKLTFTGEDQVSGMISGISGAIGGLGTVALGVAAAGIAALTGGVLLLGDALKSSVEQAMDMQTVMAQLNQVIASTGGVAGITSQAAQDLATHLSEISGYENDAILKGETFMLQFQNIGKDIFPQASAAAVDLARRLGTDVSSAFQAVGRALNDPEAGIGRLNTQLKLFDKEQLAAVEAMAKSGDVAGAQTMILDALNKAVGGAAEAYGNTFAGQLDKVNVKFIEMKEALGLKVIPILEDLMNRVVIPLIPMIEMMAQNFGDFLVKISESKGFNDFVNNVAFGLQNLFRALEQMSAGNFNIGGVLKQVFSGVTSGATSIFSTVDWGAIGKSFFDFLGQALVNGENFLKSIDWGAIGKKIADFLGEAIKNIGGFFSGIDWKQVSEDVIKAIKSIDWTAVGQGIHDGLITAWNLVSSYTSVVGDYFKKMFHDVNWLGIAMELGLALDQLIAGLFGTNLDDAVGKPLITLASNIRGAFVGLQQTIANIIGAIITPFIIAWQMLQSTMNSIFTFLAPFINLWEAWGQVVDEINKLKLKIFEGELYLLFGALKVTGDYIGGIFVEVWNSLGEALHPVTDSLKQAANIIGTSLSQAWVVLEKAIAPVIGQLGDVANIIGGSLIGAWNTLVTIYQNNIRPMFEWLYNFIHNSLIGAWDGIILKIMNMTSWLNTLAATLRTLTLPAWLTPGSPTPLENGLRGISDAMSIVSSKSLPAFSNTFSGASTVSAPMSGNGGITINLQYAPALTTNTQADIEKIMPVIAEGVNRQARNLGLNRR